MAQSIATEGYGAIARIDGARAAGGSGAGLAETPVACGVTDTVKIKADTRLIQGPPLRCVLHRESDSHSALEQEEPSYASPTNSCGGCFSGRLPLCLLSSGNAPCCSPPRHRTPRNGGRSGPEEALPCEVYGLMDQRNALLDRAAELAPDYAAGEVAPRLRHVSGPVNSGEDVAQWSSRDRKFSEYAAMRDLQPDTVVAICAWLIGAENQVSSQPLAAAVVGASVAARMDWASEGSSKRRLIRSRR